MNRFERCETFFTYARPGEARACKWEDYDGKKLHIRESIWRTHTTPPKTPESVAPVPVGETLREILEETRRESGYILSSPIGKPVDLHNLAARVVIPALSRCAECKKEEKEHDGNGHKFRKILEWHGWYAFRRGFATLAASVDSQLAAKSLLRHSNVHTTQAFYIKSVPADAIRAVEKMDALFQKAADGVPN